MRHRMARIPLLFALGLAGAGAHAACSKDAAPSIPDGKAASEAEMGAAQAAVKGYIANANAYLACVQTALDSAATPKAEKAALNKQYNATVDEMQAVAGKWKTAITAFKSK